MGRLDKGGREGGRAGGGRGEVEDDLLDEEMRIFWSGGAWFSL